MGKQWKIPVSWEMCGLVSITADTLEEAIDLAKDDDSIVLPTGDYVDGSFSVSLDDPDKIREFYNNNQPDEISVRQAIHNFMAFEKETSIIYPFASDFEELSEEILLKIEEKCSGHIDAETLYDALEEIVGENPILKDSRFVAAAFSEYQKKRALGKIPLNAMIQSVEAMFRDEQNLSERKGREETHER